MEHASVPWDPTPHLAAFRPPACAASPAAVQSSLEALRVAFVQVLGASAAARFAPPPALRTWLLAAGGSATGGLVRFLPLPVMVDETVGWLGAFTWEACEGERPATGPWVQVASRGDKHAYFLCCDRTHPELGHVCVGHDIVPWMDEGALSWQVDLAHDPFTDPPLPADARWDLPGFVASAAAAARRR